MNLAISNNVYSLCLTSPMLLNETTLLSSIPTSGSWIIYLQLYNAYKFAY